MHEITFAELERVFRHPAMRRNQREAFLAIESTKGSITLELPTGSGKMDIGATVLKALAEKAVGPLFYVTPNKAQVQQVEKAFAHDDAFRVVYGRGEHECLFYPERWKANEVPCAYLTSCAHRVDQESGETHTPGAERCPYYQQKYEAKQGKIVISTTAFYIFTALYTKEWGDVAALVIDEAHRLAQTVQSCLTFDITDWHLRRAITLLQNVDASTTSLLDGFLSTMIRIIKHKPANKKRLLDEGEIGELMDQLVKIDAEALRAKIGEAVRCGLIDPLKDRIALKQLEVIARDVPRYLNAFGYSLPAGDRHPLNFTCAFYEEQLEEGKRVQYRLTIEAGYVAPIIRRILAPYTIVYSARIDDAEVFGYETGIKFPYFRFPSEFPVDNRRIFLPTDTPHLVFSRNGKKRDRREPTRVLRSIARDGCKVLAEAGERSLVIVVSNAELAKFLRVGKDEGLRIVTYGDGVAAKDALARFKAGEGDVLAGVFAHFGEGIDLPDPLCRAIFLLRPNWPVPDEPRTIYEQRRFRSNAWPLFMHRVRVSTYQAAGRNIRTETDKGVVFCISQDYRRWLRSSLPKELQSAYRGDVTFKEGVQETLQLLRGNP